MNPKDYLKYCSNLDDDDSLWEDYEVENTWIDKIYDFVFDIRWSIYTFFINLGKKWKY